MAKKPAAKKPAKPAKTSKAVGKPSASGAASKAKAATKDKKPAAPAPKGSAKVTDAKKPDIKKPETKKPSDVKKVDPKKPESKKPEIKKPEVKKSDLKKPVGKPEPKKAEPAKAEAHKHDPKKPDGKKGDAKKPEAVIEAAPPAGEGETDGKGNRKGITVVTPKPMKRPRPKALPANYSNLAGQLMGAGSPVRRPLISSGSHAPASRPLGVQGVEAAPAQPTAKNKTHLNKKQLDHFRAVLLRKRAELFGDVSAMESEALTGGSGSLSNLPQHIADQGSDAYDQSLALDLAAADRKLIKEIDDALLRIDDGSFGVCEITGKPIKPERLEELPWARHSIEAARELERQHMRAM